jgi:hypothetical protein
LCFIPIFGFIFVSPGFLWFILCVTFLTLNQCLFHLFLLGFYGDTGLWNQGLCLLGKHSSTWALPPALLFFNSFLTLYERAIFLVLSIFFFVFSFYIFDLVVFWHEFIWVYLFWGLLNFLGLQVWCLCQAWDILRHYFSRYLSSPVLSSTWDSSECFSSYLYKFLTLLIFFILFCLVQFELLFCLKVHWFFPPPSLFVV